MKITNGAIPSNDGSIRDHVGYNPQARHFFKHLAGAIQFVDTTKSFQKNVAGAHIGDDAKLGVTCSEQLWNKAKTMVLDHRIEESVEGADGALDTEGWDGKEDAHGVSGAGSERESTNESYEGILTAPQARTAEGREDGREKVESAEAG
ncbi:hypothetical protein HPP92_008888 [Vanilla planifolia]|uniref:Uncharacterized protein n=1 Tax=Vanilla planifolia TaxID=51239 RepID=A0A835V2C7_VANPL|nr:hypothetical protein HPP92_008888 [Vanilla planifolia]